jgi:DNA excision repair protein ERCC-2
MPDQPAYTIAVRALCEFTAKRGDLDLRFTPSPTAQQGMAGHKLVTARRGERYQAELSLSDTFGTRPRGRLRPRPEPAGRDQDVSRQAQRHS